MGVKYMKKKLILSKQERIKEMIALDEIALECFISGAWNAATALQAHKNRVGLPISKETYLKAFNNHIAPELSDSCDGSRPEPSQWLKAYAENLYFSRYIMEG